MRKLALAIVAAATLLIGSIAPASAHWRHHGWGGPGSVLGLLWDCSLEHWRPLPHPPSIMDRSMVRPTTTAAHTG